MAWVKPEIDVSEGGGAPDHESRPDEEHEGQRHLGTYEPPATRLPRSREDSPAHSSFQSRLQARAARGHGGPERGRQAGRDRYDERKREHAPVHRDFRGPRQLVGEERAEDG